MKKLIVKLLIIFFLTTITNMAECFQLEEKYFGGYRLGSTLEECQKRAWEQGDSPVISKYKNAKTKDKYLMSLNNNKFDKFIIPNCFPIIMFRDNKLCSMLVLLVDRRSIEEIKEPFLIKIRNEIDKTYGNPTEHIIKNKNGKEIYRWHSGDIGIELVGDKIMLSTVELRMTELSL